MSEFPVVEDQKFFKCRLNELADYKNYAVQEYAGGRSILEIAEAIIKDVRYPFWLGQPDDTHVYNCFHGGYKWCRRIDPDYWQHASETLTILVGDCEDSSIAFLAASHAIGLQDVWELFGLVKDAQTGEVLGGHGWNAFWFAGFYHLYESTLDTPPSEYPCIGATFDAVKEPFQFGNLVYDPYWIWNAFEFHCQHEFQLGFITLGESMKKYRAIEEAWKRKTKVLTEYTKRSSKIKRLLRKVLRK